MRRRRPQEPENHERWLVSYADFITLLFAFFVVMYAISSVNEGKYRILSESLVAAFRSQPKSLEPVQVGDPVKSPWVDTTERIKTPRLVVAPLGMPLESEGTVRPDVPVGQDPAEQVPRDNTGQQALARISAGIRSSLSSLIEKDLVVLRRDKLWLEVEIKTSILFPSGSSAMEQTALPILKELARILKDFPNPIQVEGFTDNVPINSLAYPSNWELSAARAASVVHLFNGLGVKPERMAAVGYGEHRPIADNATPEGRNKNRRVVLQILAQSEARRVLDIGRVIAKGN
jgi:chemotaxis protein MotB